jgi:hypothetical protein
MSSLYCFSEEDLKKLIKEVKNTTASDDMLLNIFKIESRGIVDEKEITHSEIWLKCCKPVTDEHDHQVHSGNWNNSSEWDCEKHEFPTCLKCLRYVDDEYDHQVFEGDQTYSSEWNCNK